MVTVTRRLRSRVTTAALALLLVGGTVGIEAVASHYSNEVVHPDRSLPGSAPHGTGAAVTTPSS